MTAVWRVFWRSIRLAAHVLVGTLLTVLLARRGQDGSRRHRRAVVRWWHAVLCRLLHVRVHVSGAPPAAPSLLVANHVSWLDVPVLGGLGEIAFLSKAEVKDWPVVGWLAAAAGTQFIARGAGDANNVRDRIGAHLSGAGSLTLFPEGTTTDGSEVRPFFPRLLAAAHATGVPVVPVALRYLRGAALDTVAPFIGDDEVASHLWRVLQQEAFDVHVVFCRPIDPAHLDRRALADLARSRIVGALDDLGGRAAGGEPSTPPTPAP
ncbi:MAG: 1-acyl-sn-glycerol-3-phosphate acyltransferase [Gammaproteobacteria bacterium]|nr:1-acyl-sn-glycerol-3-phosphate acyltransferase [Gammaproteobacteria bacterium]